MTPLEHQAIIERIVKLESEQSHISRNFDSLRTDIDKRLIKLEETLETNHKETKKSLEEVKEALLMVRGIGKFVGWIVAGVTLVIAVVKFFMP